jgi:hypothetical protein
MVQSSLILAFTASGACHVIPITLACDNLRCNRAGPGLRICPRAPTARLALREAKR